MNSKDEVILQHWLEEDPENRQKLEFIKELHQSGSDESDEDFFRNLNVEEDWASVSAHLRRKRSGGKRSRRHRLPMTGRRREPAFYSLLKVAALLLIAFTSAYVTMQLLYEPVVPGENQEMAVPKEISTDRGERANITLGDGTKVSLSVESRLLIAQNFGEGQRRVTLEGEAFFDVTRDSERPFLIEASGSVTEVLGTSFGVRSYEKDTAVQVVVKSGTVALRNMKMNDNNEQLSSGADFSNHSEPESVILEAGEIGVLAKDDRSLSSATAENTDEYFGWMQNRLIFRQAPIEEVIETLERWYDVAITQELSNRDMEEIRLTLNMRKGHIRDVLELLYESAGIQYEIDEDNHIVLF